MGVSYPAWICSDCARKMEYPPRTFLSTFHPGECGWCKRKVAVTQPRDFGWPPYDGQTIEHPKAETASEG